MKKSLLISALSTIAVALWAIACAGSKEHTITSSPPGAMVRVNGEVKGATPVVLRVDGERVLTLEKAGYQRTTGNLGQNSPASMHFELEKAAPSTFTRTLEPTWAGIEIRQDLDYERAWNAVVDLLTRRFDLEVLSKENGYIRTNWLYSWTGAMTEDYKVRVTIKFAPNHSKLEVKSEAHFKTSNGWEIGTDEALLQTLKTDIMGTVGRATR